MALLVYGMGVRAHVMQRRVARLREQQHMLELGGSSRPLPVELLGGEGGGTGAKERCTSAIARVCRVARCGGQRALSSLHCPRRHAMPRASDDAAHGGMEPLHCREFVLGVAHTSSGMPAMYFANQVTLISAHTLQSLEKLFTFQLQRQEKLPPRTGGPGHFVVWSTLMQLHLIL